MRTFAVVVAGYCSFLELYATQPLLPLFSRIFGASSVAVSMTVTAAAFGVALSAPLAGRLTDRFGKKRVIVTSAFLLSFVSYAAASASSLNLLIFWRLCQGLVTPGIFAAVVAYVNDEFAGNPGATMSAYISGTVSGGFSSRFIAGWVAAHFDWQWVFIVLGTLNLVGAFVIWAILKPDSVVPEPSPRTSFWVAAADHLRNRLLLATFAVGSCMLFTQIGVFTYVTFYLAADPFLLSTSALGSLFTVYLAGVVMNPVAGRLIDRYGQRTVVSGAIGVTAFGILMTLIVNLWVVCLGLALCSVGVFAAQTASNGFLGLAARHHRALAVGLYSTFYYLGGSAGGAVPGYFYDWGGWPACVAFIVCIQLLTLLNARLFWRQPGPAASAVS